MTFCAREKKRSALEAAAEAVSEVAVEAAEALEVFCDSFESLDTSSELSS